MLYCLCCTLILPGRVGGWAEVQVTIFLILFLQHKFKEGADGISPKFRWNLTDTFRTKDTNMANQVYLSLPSTLAIACLMLPHIHSHVQGSLEPVRHTLSHRSRGFELVAYARVSVCVCCVYLGVSGGTVGLYQQEPNFTCHPLSLTLPVFMLLVCVSVCVNRCRLPAPCCHPQDSLILGHMFLQTHAQTHKMSTAGWLLHVYRFSNAVGGPCVFHHSPPVDRTAKFIIFSWILRRHFSFEPQLTVTKKTKLQSSDSVSS